MASIPEYRNIFHSALNALDVDSLTRRELIDEILRKLGLTEDELNDTSINSRHSILRSQIGTVLTDMERKSLIRRDENGHYRKLEEKIIAIRDEECEEEILKLIEASPKTKADIKDAQDNKVMAVLAYFGPLVLIPILAAKGSKFARYHSNQGLVLFIACVAYSIAYGILSSIILAISWRLYFITSILSFVGLIFTVLAVIGIINACKGEMKPLPVLGSIKILK